jgi:hypothetical protein
MQGYGRQAGLAWPRGPRPLALAVAALALAAGTAACGSAPAAPAGTFTPGAGTSGPAAAAPSPVGGTGADDYVMPPFAASLHVTMTSWLPPAGSPLIPAVVAAKDWYLALYYSESLGGTDTGWMNYTAGTAQPNVGSYLKGPVIAGQSFTGTLVFGDMSAAPDKTLKGDVDVFMCVQSSRTTEVFYPSEKPEPKQPPLGMDNFRQQLYLAEGSNGQWYMVGSGAPDYIPARQGC